MPAISAPRQSHPATQWAKNIAPRNGNRKLMKPIEIVSRQCFAIVRGSISAPARNVSRPLPKPARKSTHAVLCSWNALPTTMPTRISISATATPVRAAITAAMNASPIQTAAVAYGFTKASTNRYGFVEAINPGWGGSSLSAAGELHRLLAKGYSSLDGFRRQGEADPHLRQGERRHRAQVRAVRASRLAAPGR